MRRFAAAVTAAFMLILTLSGCGDRTAPDDGKLRVVCTVFPQYDFVREIASDKVELKMLLPLGMESHDFKLENLSIADLKTAGSADLFLYIGGESDSEWVGELRDTLNVKNTKWIALTDMTDTLEEEESDSMTAEGSGEHGHGENGYDEHVWTSPLRAVEITRYIAGVLCELDPDNADFYNANCSSYAERLGGLDAALRSVAESAKRRTLIFADRFPFRYLCADYGIDFDAAFNGCSESGDPSVAQINSLCKTAESTGAPVIFYMENSDPLYARRIAEMTGARPLMLHSCHTVTKDEFSGGATYLSLMKENIGKIAEALG